MSGGLKPFVLPASTGLALVAGAVTTLICTGLRHAGINLSPEEQGAVTVIITALVGHFTTDSPPAPVAREAIDVAANKVDRAAARTADEAAIEAADETLHHRV